MKLFRTWFLSSVCSIDFFSHHAKSQKSGLIYGAIHRAIHLCSQTFLFQKEVSYITKCLIAQNYPIRFIDFHIKKAIEKFSVPKFKLLPCVAGPELDNPVEVKSPNNVSKCFFSFPYIKNLDNKLKNIANSAGLNIGFRPGQQIKNILNNHKHKIHKLNTAGCVYKISCKDCSGVYVGETARSLRVRASEHRRALKNNDQNYAVVGHMNHSGHVIDTDNPMVLSKEKSWSKRLWLEAAHIQRSNVFKNIGKKCITGVWNPFLALPE